MRNLRRRFWIWVARKTAPHIPARYGVSISGCHFDNTRSLDQVTQIIREQFEEQRAA